VKGTDVPILNKRRIKLLIGKYQGCLLGLAIGDALGAPWEPYLGLN